MIDLSVVIVNYNAGEYLKRCLNSLFESSLKNLEIIVVDNASRDGSVEELRKIVPKIKLIINKNNSGFSSANNQGLKVSRGRYVLFLNPDTNVYPKTLEYMLKFMDKNKDAGAATCKVLLPNGILDDASHRGFPTPWNAFCYFSGLEMLFPRSRIFGGYHMGWEDLRKTHQIKACAGAFVLVRREAGDDIDWWDKDYFFYGEDLDFCLELLKKEWKIYFVPRVSILHYKGISSGIKNHSKHLSHANLETQKVATVARYDSMKILYKKQYRGKYPIIVDFLVDWFINLKFWYSTKKIRS